MFRKVAVTAACVVLAAVVPALEINATHLLNPQWPSHARLHEAWQVLTNAGLAVACLWLTWIEGRTRLAALVMLIVCLSFLAAVFAAPVYGGSMQHADGTELTFAGVNAAAAVMFGITAGLAGAVMAPGPGRRAWR